MPGPPPGAPPSTSWRVADRSYQHDSYQHDSYQHDRKDAMVPALDAAAYEILAEDLASHAIALEFMASFESLLAGRIQRIERALRNQDREEAITALLSLQASAAIAGATELHASATRALATRSMETTVPGPLVRKLQGQASRFRSAFATLLPHSVPVPQSPPLDKLA